MTSTSDSCSEILQEKLHPDMFERNFPTAHPLPPVTVSLLTVDKIEV